MSAPPRVAVVTPFWEFWEASARGDLRGRLHDLTSRASPLLEGVEVVAQEVLLSADQAQALAQRITTADPEVIVVLQVMAVPPARTMAVLDALPAVPVVVWGVHERTGAGEDFDHSDITTEGATVGTSQLANLLVRSSRSFDVCIGRLDDPAHRDKVTDLIHVAAATRRVSTSVLIRIGDPPAGYDCVTCDLDALRSAVGVTVVDLAPAELARRFVAVSDADVERIHAETLHEFTLDPALPADDEGLRRSMRFAAAFETLGRELGATAGALNCHLPELRYSTAVGVTPCFALGRETSREIPWTCAGDILTALAMMTTKALGGAALYHELETIDYQADELVIANTGEHDLAWADPSATRELRANDWFATDPLCGVCAHFGPPAGPATLVAFTEHPQEPSGFRYIVAEGSFGDRRFPDAGTPSGTFRFTGRRAPDGFEAWARAGANHHSSATPGHFADRVAQLASSIGVGCTRIS